MGVGKRALILGASIAAGCLAVVPAAAAAPAAAAVSSAPAEIERAAEPIPDQYIVTLRDSRPTASPFWAGVLASRYRGSVLDVYDRVLHGFTIHMSEAEAQELVADPAVAGVEEDGVVRASSTESIPPVNPGPTYWGLDRLDQTDLPLSQSYTYDPSAATVHAYVLDTGIRVTHPDFGGRASSGFDFVSNDTNADDCNGHGTHVAATIGGNVFGVAKNVSLVAVRVLGGTPGNPCSGSGAFSTVIAGVNWVTANAIKPAVANMSLGGSGSSALDSAISNSIASGVTYAVAAGNATPTQPATDACLGSPARLPEAFTVAASDATDARAGFSNFGPCVDAFAPGVDILSAGITGYGVAKASGTSMASPHAAGAAAAYLARYPSATPADVMTALSANATVGHVSSPGSGTPNVLLATGFLVTPYPPAVTATNGHTTTQLAWPATNDGGSPITAYKVYRGTSPGGENPTPLATLGGGASQYVDSAVTVGTTYYYTIGAVNAFGETRSVEVSATPLPPTTPDPPTLTATGTFSKVGLSWNVPSNGGSPITGYKVYRGVTPAGENPTPITTVGAGTTTFDDTAVVNGTTYYYQVAGVNALGETRSAEQAATPVAPSPPDAPVLAASTSSGSVHLSWTVPATHGAAITGYKVYRGTTPGGEGATPIVNGVGASPYDDATVTNGTTYYYQVSAKSTVGEGPRSAEQTATPNAQPQTVSGAGAVTQASELGTPATTVNEAAGLSVFARGEDDAVYWDQRVGSAWSGWQSLGGTATSDPVAVSASSGLYVLARGAGNGLVWQRRTGGVWSGWQSGGGVATSRPGASVDGQGVEVFVRGSDNALWRGRITNAGTWSGWTLVGGQLTSDPVVVTDSAGVEVFVRGTDNALWQGRLLANGTWSGWQLLGGQLTSNVGVGVDSAGVEVFVRGTDNALWSGRLTGGLSWSGWQLRGGQLTSDPVAAPAGASAVDVYVRGSDNLLWQGRLSGGSSWSGWQLRGGQLTANVAATSDGGGTSVVGRDVDATLRVGTLQGTVWSGWSVLL